MSTYTTWLNSEQRRFIYSLGRDLVWLIPGHVSGPVGSALITVLESYDPVESWKEDVSSQLSKLSLDIQHFMALFDAKQDLLSLQAYLEEIARARKAVAEGLRHFMALESTDAEGRQIQRLAVISLLKECQNKLCSQLELDIEHKVTALGLDPDLHLTPSAVNLVYSDDQAYACTLLKFNALLLGITTVLFAYKTLIEFVAWENSLGAATEPGRAQALFILMRTFQESYTLATASEPAPLERMAQQILRRRHLSVGPVERLENIPFSIDARFSYSEQTGDPFFAPRKATAHASAGHYSCGDNLNWKSYWACFDIFPLDDAELITQYGGHKSENLETSAQVGRFIGSNVHIKCRVLHTQNVGGFVWPTYNQRDSDLYDYVLALPTAWSGFGFKDLVLGKTFHTLDDCWVSWTLRHSMLRHFESYPDLAAQRRSAYLEAVKQIAEHEFAEGTPSALKQRMLEWQQLCEQVQLSNESAPKLAPEVTWGVEDLNWQEPELEVRYSISYYHQHGVETSRIFTPWHRACGKRPVLSQICAPKFSEAFMHIRIYRELKMGQRIYAPKSFLSILLPKLIPNKDIEMATEWTDEHEPIFAS